MDDRLHNWSDDDRASRIREVLASSPSLTGEDMRLLQLDTTSRFHKELILWLLKHGSTSFLTTQQRADWEAWDGNIRTCPLCMSEASDAATLLDQMILRTVARNFNRTGTDFPYVKRQMERARVVMFMELPDIPAKLGFDDQEIATGIIKSVARVPVRRTNPWPERNHWAVQHPFVGRLPLIGSFFSVPAPAQFGAPSVLRAEKPTHGPSTRIIWEPSNPASSSWSFPTGVSGHALSNHYSDWSNLWQQGGAVAIPAAI